MARNRDRELMERALRRVLSGPSDTAKAMEAQTTAARQLARMNGIPVSEAKRERDPDADLPLDPFEAYDELVAAKRRRYEHRRHVELVGAGDELERRRRRREGVEPVA